MKLSELTRKDEIGIVSMDGYLPPDDADLSDPQYDSRKVSKGSTFVAIKGFAVDGHAYITSAIERGARVIVVQDEKAFSAADAESKHVTRIVVRDSRAALAYLSELYFGEPGKTLRMIGVTGTNGKTTTANVIKQLLELGDGKPVGMIGTIGTWIGEEYIPSSHTTPESRDLSELLAMMVKRGVGTCVMEVSSHALVLKRVAAIDFDIAVFTNLTQDHLDFHPTMEDYFKAKQLLFQGLKDTAVAISNADNLYGERMVSDTVANSHTYGVARSEDDHGHADLLARDLRQSLHETSFILQKRYSDEQAEFSTSLIGRFNVENILAAISALYFGVEGYSLSKLSELIPRVKSVRGRYEQVVLKNGSIAIIDYAHTPDALQNVLRASRELMEQTGSNGRLWCVFGCGGDRDRKKRPLMGSIASHVADRLILTNDNPRSENPRDILHEIEAGLMPGSSYEVIEDRREAIRTALAATSASDIVVIAGKGHEAYQIIGKDTTHFDDREEVLAWIESVR